MDAQIREEAMDWLLRLDPAPDDDPAWADFRAWYARSPAHRDAYQRVAHVWRLSGDLDPQDVAADAAPTAHAGQPTRAHQSGRRPPRAKHGRRGRTPLVAGATALAVACLAVVLMPEMRLHLTADHATGVGELRRVQLEDGSRVHLGAASAVDVVSDPQGRGVRLLRGQAFFDVVADANRPFTVDTPRLSVRVTGTAFAVDRTGGTTSVAVQSGSVAVHAKGGDPQRVDLSPGDRLVLVSGTNDVTFERTRPSEVGAWRTGRLAVDGMPLGELVAQLDRYHRGVIWFADADLADRRVTGVFQPGRPEAALRAAAAAHCARVTAVTPYLLAVSAD